MPRRLNFYVANKLADRLDEFAAENCISRNAAACMVFANYFSALDAQKNLSSLSDLIKELDDIKSKMNDLQENESAS